MQLSQTEVRREECKCATITNSWPLLKITRIKWQVAASSSRQGPALHRPVYTRKATAAYILLSNMRPIHSSEALFSYTLAINEDGVSQLWYVRNSEVPKCEIFDGSDFHDFYTIYSLFGLWVKI